MLAKILGLKSNQVNDNESLVHQLWQESLCFPFFADQTVDYNEEYINHENNWNLY